MPRASAILGCVALAVVLAAAQGAASHWLGQAAAGWSDLARLGLIVGAQALILALGALVARAWLAASSTRLARAIEDAAAERTVSTLPNAGWLGPVAHAAERALQQLARQAEESSRMLRDTEIRRSVSEVDRQHGEAILHSLRDAVVVTDSFNELTLANPSAASVLGFELAKAEHRPVKDVIRDDTLRRLIDEVRQSGVPNKQKRVEHAITLDEGHGPERRLYDVTLACLPDPHEGVGGVVTILRDITKEKEISQMKSDFVSQASHELRTPLASINAYIEMLLDSEAQDEAGRQEFYRIIKSEVDRVCRLIDNMLNISRIEAGIVQVERSEVDFVRVVREVIGALQPHAAEKKIMLLEKSGPLVYTAQADRDLIHQVVVNLVSNGVKYTPEGGRVTVTVDNDDTTRSVLVTVADTGLGIPPEAMGRIFDKFYRIENYKRVAKGTGLGLNLVRHIVETVHRGKVGVTSELGMGSKFWFSIPYELQNT